MTATDRRCSVCDARLQEGDRFCEQCGARLDADEAATASCHACGAAADAIGEDGYCSVCGVRAPDPGDRIELDLSIAAGVSDRGRVHRRNEDAFQVQVGEERRVAVVVCDGISSASAGNVAAQEGAEAAASVLARALAEPARDGSTATIDAIRAANGAVEQVPWTTRKDRVDPSCTFVSALCRDGEIVIGWAGDSRAYWIDSGGPRQLTVDDSWAAEGVAKGLVTPEQAARSPALHSITNWVGPDAPEGSHRLVVLRPDRPGRLVLCTDGLWNYVTTAAELGGLIDALPAGASPAAVARALTDTAVDRGGRDNVTVAVVDIDPS